MTSAWQALVSKIYKEHKGTMNAEGKPFLPKDAMMLAKKVYKKPEGSATKTKSTGKRGRKKRGGAADARFGHCFKNDQYHALQRRRRSQR